MPENHVVSVKVWGDYACFTRPELKVERMSYPIMTPSGARGVLDAILFKKKTDPRTGQLVPAFHWHIRRITALKAWWLNDNAPDRPEFESIRRNEIQGKIPLGTVRKWMREPNSAEPCLVDSTDDNRVQRNTLLLRNVAYRIDASIHMDAFDPVDPPIKYREMFLRRVEKGQCFHRPYLGCREFACDFAACDGTEQSMDWSEGLGLMLYDVRYGLDGENQPGFFTAALSHGVLHCDTADKGPNGEAPVTVHGWEAKP